MELNVVDNTQTNLDGQSFTVELNSFLFDIMINKGYKDKIQSVLREISCNARDSHKLAGNDEPFHVHIPTRTELFYRLRDFGVGLSKENIYALYTRVGASDKRNSNDFTGCIGIGSKSVFAYVSQHTKNFKTTSYFNGVKTTYVCYIDGETQMPSIDELYEEETDEPNGLEIEFDVRLQDVHSFEENARRVYSIFDLKPKTNIELNYPVIENGFKWKMNGHYVEFDAQSNYRDRQSGLIMGNVFYPISYSDVSGLNIDKLADYVNYGVIFNAPMGAVSFTPFRESLEFTQQTINYLTRASRDISTSYEKVVNDEIDKCESIWEATIKRYNSLYGASLSRDFLHNCKYRGVELKDYIEISEEIPCVHRGDKEEYESSKIYPERTIVLFKDNNRSAKTKANKLKAQNGRCITVDKESILKELGLTKSHPNVVLASTLDKVTKSTRNASTEVMEYKRGYNVGNMWKNTTTTIHNGYYVPTYHLYAVNRDNGQVQPTDFMIIFDSLSQAVKDKMYGVRAKTLKEVQKKGSGWKNIWDVIDKKQAALEKLGVDKLINLGYCLDYDNEHCEYHKTMRLMGVMQDLDNPYCKKYKKVIDSYENAKKQASANNRVDILTAIYKAKGIKLPENRERFSLDFLNDFFADYPLLAHIEAYSIKSEHVKKYIEGE